MQQYAIVTGIGTLEKLVDEINQMLSDGWVPLGPPFPTGRFYEELVDGEVVHREPIIAQALVCGDTARRLERG